MVNREEQTKILIDGPGFVARKNRDYRPGEYRRLTNVELDNGRLRGRDNILSSDVDTTGIGDNWPFLGVNSPIQDAIGVYGHWTIYCDGNSQFAYSSSGARVRMFDLNSMPEVLNSGTFPTLLLKVLSFFEYNNKVYWLTMRNFGDAFTYYSLVWCDSSLDKDPSNLGTTSNPLIAIHEADATNSIMITDGDDLFLGFKYNNSFIFKERLWICNSEIIYFSKPTDPTKFNVEDGGGFFRFNDDTINYLLDGGDILYVICDGSIYTITYNTDPNIDAVVRKITSNIGGTHGCIFRSTPYFINLDGVYSIDNNGITKIMDSNLDEGINDYTSQKLTSYNNYIYINKTYLKSQHGIPSPNSGANDVVYNLYPNYFAQGSIARHLWDLTSGATLDFKTDVNSNQLNVVDIKFKPYVTKTVSFTSGTKISIDPNERYTFNFSNQISFDNNTITTSTEAKTHFVISFKGYNVANGLIPNGVTTYGTKDWRIDLSKYTTLWPNGVPKTIGISCTSEVSYIEVEFNYYIADSSYIDTRSEIIWTIGNYLLTKGDYPDISYFDASNISTSLISYDIEPRLWGDVVKKTSLLPYYRYYLDLVPWLPKNPISGNNLGYNTYKLNMDTGSMSVVDFKPYLNLDCLNFNGFIYDIFYNSNPDPLTGVTSLMFATSDLDDVNGYGDYAGKAGVFFSGPNTDDVQDIVIVSQNGRDTSRPIKPRYEIEVDSFTPDATEYVVKKFRSLEIMGTFPQEEFELAITYNDVDYSNKIQLVDAKKDSSGNAFNLRSHFPHRIGLNQRGQSIAIRMRSTNISKVQDPGVPNVYDYLEISDMNMLWTYTQRSQKYSSYSNKV